LNWRLLNKSKESDVAAKDLKDLSVPSIIPYDMWEAIKQKDLAEQARNAMQQAQSDHVLDAQVWLTNAQRAQAQANAQQVHKFAPNALSQQALSQQAVSGTTAMPSLAARARELFLKRMGGIRAELRVADDDFLQCHIYGEVVYLFYCFGGRAGVTQESIDLFPSDQLITQFRMVLST
jgi:hypothetical protein